MSSVPENVTEKKAASYNHLTILSDLFRTAIPAYWSASQTGRRCWRVSRQRSLTRGSSAPRFPPATGTGRFCVLRQSPVQPVHRRLAWTRTADDEMLCLGFINIHRFKYKSSVIELMDNFQCCHHIFFNSRNRLVAFFCLQFVDFIQAHGISQHHAGSVKCLRANGKICRIERQRLVHLDPRNTIRHDNVSNRMCLREHVLDFLT